MKKIIPSIIVLTAASAALAAIPPRLSNVTQRVDGHNDVVVSYHLDQEAIVTATFTVGGEAVDPAHYTTLAGDVNRALPAGDHTIKWRPRKEGFAGDKLVDGRVKVVAWSLDAPPPVMAMALDRTDTIRFYPGVDYLPGGGLTNLMYKKNWMVFRKIPAAGVTWRMGTPTSEIDSSQTAWIANEWPHRVSFSEDYYMAVYECTRAQWKIYAQANGWDLSYDHWIGNGQQGGVNESWTSGDNNTELMPISRISWQYLINCNWPTDRAVKGIFKWMRERAGGAMEFNLPTDAQWEYACRAGTTTALPDGTSRRSETGPYWTPDRQDTDGLIRKHIVGELPPNGFGLYDIIGNVSEWCLDVIGQPLKDDETDPLGPSDGKATFDASTEVVFRGGSYDNNNQWATHWQTFQHRSATRCWDVRSAHAWDRGFRVAAPARYRFPAN